MIENLQYLATVAAIMALFAIVLAVIAIRVARKGARALELAQKAHGVIASTRPDPVEADAVTVKNWERQLARHPEGSPKHTAYKARLAAIAASNADGG